MNKLIKTALISTVLMALTSLSSFGAVLKVENFKDELEYNIVKRIKKDIPGDIQVKITTIPVDSIEIPQGLLIFDVDVNTKQVNPNSIAKINVMVDDKKITTVGIPFTVSIKDTVWITTEPIQKGKAFTKDNLTMKKTDITKKTNCVLRNKFKYSKFFAGKRYKKGEIVDARYLTPIPDVSKNTPISILFQTKNLKFTLDGVSLDDGKIGDYIKVKSYKYDRFYTGKIVSTNLVLVKI